MQCYRSTPWLAVYAVQLCIGFNIQKEIGVCIGTDKARGIKVERLFKRRNGKYIWWFELNSSEKLLVEVESLWHHDYWRLERL